MVTRVPKYLGGLGIDLTNTVDVLSNATVTLGDGLTSGNISLGGRSVSGNVVSLSNVYDSTGDVRSIPLNEQTTSYIITKTDRGKYISTNSTVTIRSGLMDIGGLYTVYNNSASSISIVQDTGTTMYLGGTSFTGNRTLTQRGVATLLLVSANLVIATGAGLT